MAINKDWHLKNKMPKKPSLQQRVKWHEEHEKNCSCREMPKDIRKIIEDGKRKTKKRN
jgi:hypothetical protein